MANLLIIDDDNYICEVLSQAIKKEGHDVSYALSATSGLQQLRESAFDIVFLDVQLPDGNGLSLLPHIRQLDSKPEVIIITANADLEGAREAIENGAWDYVNKPISIASISPILESALDYRKHSLEILSKADLDRKSIIGSSPVMEEHFKLINNATKSEVNVLIIGETGTGKELTANIIHQNSNRAGKQIVTVDCASIPENLAETVLFGHVKGAFTGANKPRQGLVAQAHDSTLFLDEIGELPLSTQKTFLRILQEKRFRPVGGKAELKSNFRLISATNRDLSKMVAEGTFRADLLFRLQSMMIESPPLRKRKSDIAELVMFHIKKRCHLDQTKPKFVSPELGDILQKYDWPGNVRELFNTLDNCIANAHHGTVLYPKHLPTHLRVQVTQATFDSNSPPGTVGENGTDGNGIPLLQLKDFRKQAALAAERDYLLSLLNIKQINIDTACKISGLSRSRLYELLKKHNLTAPTRSYFHTTRPQNLE